MVSKRGPGSASAIRKLRRDGYVIVPDVVDPRTLAGMRRAIERHRLGFRGRNPFEGHRTERVYTLVARGRVFEQFTEHPQVLAICDAFLDANYLLSASQSIEIRPGEAPQAFHADDLFYPIARPRKPFSIAVILAIDEFTEENGATEVIPGSHRWSDRRLTRAFAAIGGPTPPQRRLARQVVPATMPPGSMLVTLGTTVHRGGANRSRAPRLAITNQYCEPWARPQENYFLGVPRTRAARMSERVQELLGYSIHPPFMGHVTGLHPKRRLTTSARRGADRGASPRTRR